MAATVNERHYVHKLMYNTGRQLFVILVVKGVVPFPNCRA
jgi:hypothetical protein